MQESSNFDNAVFAGSQLLHSIVNLRMYHNIQQSLYFEATITKKQTQRDHILEENILFAPLIRWY